MLFKVIHAVNTLRRGGAERQLHTIMQNSASTINAIITSHLPQYSYFTSVSNEQKIIHVRGRSLYERVLFYRSVFRQTKPDVVYAWGAGPYFTAILASQGLKLKVVNGSIRHGVFKFSLGSFFRLVLLHLSRFVVANSEAGIKANLLKSGIVLYNGIDDRFDRDQRVKKRIKDTSVSDRRLVYCSIANLVPYKDYRTVFHALQRVKLDGIRFTYYIMGDGPLRVEHEELVRRLDLADSVVFLGNISDPEEYLAIADLYIHSSVGEGCPNAILEAMFMGLPVIATATGGTPEVLGENSILFELGNVEALYNAISQLSIDNGERERMGQLSYQIAKMKFSKDRMIKDYERLIGAIAIGKLDSISDLIYHRDRV